MASLLQAGDILRGGVAGSSSSRKASTARTNAGEAEAAQTAAKAKDRLSRATQAIQAVQAMQNTARGLKPNSSNQPLPAVPNGLGAGGLDLQGTPVGAQKPQQSGNKVTIRQTESQAFLNWKTFNVGKQTSVYFDQRAGGSSSGRWIAFNRITDPSGAPSQILGSIKAEGQVYIINQNGIIFGSGSQVNVRALVASALPINDNLINRGLLNNPDAQFLFSALPQAAGTKGPTPAFTPPASTLPDGSVGNVVVERGAFLSASTSAERVGGRITLVGANVENRGVISTPDGQTILAAGLQVGFAAHASSDPSLRGLDVYVGSVNYPSELELPQVGSVTNAGFINVPRGNATIAGRHVRQLGAIDSSTTTAVNGRIDLRADYGATSNTSFDPLNPNNGPPFNFQNSGIVEIGAGSVMRILPEISGTDTVPGVRLALSSQVNVMGKAIRFGADSILLAPGADVTVSAGNWLANGANSPTNRIFTGGQIYFESGALVDVSGSTGALAPLAQNILTLQLRGAELANSPLQRDGLLRGPSLTIDLRRMGTYNGFAWVGTPLGDVSGFAALIQRTVAELTAAGGTVNLTAGESVIMQPGSEIDVSGGWIRYEGGTVRTTRLIRGSQLVDIADATPDLVYDGIYNGTTTVFNSKWGISRTYAHPLAPIGGRNEQGYVQGANAGTISITAPSMALDGTLTGQAIQGQRQSNSSTVAFSKRGTLNLTFQAAETLTPFWAFSPTPPKIVFATDTVLPPAEPFAVAVDGTPAPLRADRKENLVLSPKLFTDHGFGQLTVNNSDGSITLPQGTNLNLPLLGSLTLLAANLEIGGSIIAPGGNLNFTAFNFSPFTLAKIKGTKDAAITTTPDPERGIFLLDSNAVLSTAGLITDYRRDALADSSLPPVINGGSVTIKAYTADLAPGSVIDVSGGVTVNETGKRRFGTGGSIVINAGNDPGLAWFIGGKIRLGSILKGYSGSQGGALTIQAQIIQIGDSPSEFLSSRELAASTDAEPGPEEILFLTPEFFTRGGFTSYTLAGLGKAINATAGEFVPAIAIAPGTIIRPTAESWLASTTVEAVALRKFLKPEGLRPPVSLAFTSSTIINTPNLPAQTVLRGDIVMGEGAVIETDPGATVTFNGSTVAILGSVIAPGGMITVAGGSSYPAFLPGSPTPEFNRALPTVHLGPQSHLSTAGRLVLRPDPFGRRIGTVLPGGIISVSGNIVAEAGAVLDVSGSSGILDLPPASLVRNLTDLSAPGYRTVPLNSGINAPLYSLATIPSQVDSDAGMIILQGGQEMFSDATLRGFAGGPSAQGGILVVASGRFIDATNAEDKTSPLDINLIVRQSGRNIPSGFYLAGGTAIGHMVPVADGDPIRGLGHFSVDTFLQGGFDILKLSGVGGGVSGAVQFSGPVSINARRALIVSDGGVIYADSSVLLEAPYVALGMPFKDPALPGSEAGEISHSGPAYIQPSFGRGSLTVRASLIDIGNLTLRDIGQASFLADEGDIRGNGVLNISGDLYMRAGQIYPTTAGIFTIVAYDPNITVASSSTTTTQVTLASPVLPRGFGVGSPLLGSTVTAIEGNTVTLAANANANITVNTLVTFAPGKGSVTIAGSGSRPLPLSAGGTLSVYASNIVQGGTLRAPLGTINLGWDGIGASPIDYLTGAGLQPGNSVPVTQKLVLSGGSVTSVSAIDPITGLGIIIPYGFNANGTAWIDPRGVDITAGGLPGKAVNLFALNLDAKAGSVIDVRGGGDLYAYTWITGNGGTNDILGTASGPWSETNSYTAGQLVSYGGSTWSARRASKGVIPSISLDWTLIPESFAVIPGYQANYAPYAPFNTGDDPLNLAKSDPGYVNSGLSVGDRIYLGPGSGVGAGVYTLLPARYALLPGAVLVTPRLGQGREPLIMPDGSALVSGYRFNDLNSGQLAPAQASRFEVALPFVFRARAQYDDFLAGRYLKDMAEELGFDPPRLPGDAGRVVLAGLNALRIDGAILARSTVGGYGGEIDISTAADILITGKGSKATPGTVVLSAAKLSSFGAESILVGGFRQSTPNGTLITVRTSNLVVDNAGTPFTAPEIILVARDRLTLAPGAEIVQSGSTRGSSLSSAIPLLIGDSSIAGSGNGLLLRVSDVQVPVIRSGVSPQAAQAALTVPPVLSIGAGASIQAGALVLDSTYGTSLDPSARLSAQNLALNSGRISLAFDDPGAVPPIAGLMLSGPALEGLQSSRVLSLLSYSSIDFYGTGNFNMAGTLALHSAQLRGFNNEGGLLTFSASRILLDNIAGGTVLEAGSALSGGLAFEAGTIRLGSGQVKLDQFATIELDATGGLLATGTGGLITPAAMTITAPVITAAQAVKYAITAAGDLNYLSPENAGSGSVKGGMGATFSLIGANLSVNSDIVLQSGIINLQATEGDLLVGNLNEVLLDASGTKHEFYDIVRYTNGGQVNLTSTDGSVTLGAESEIDVSAQPGGGDAGIVSIGASNGSFTLGGTFDGSGGAGGQGGSFFLDVRSLSSTSSLDLILNDASFTRLRNYRVRSGNVAVDGLATAHSYSLSADQGSIVVTSSGNIDASGKTGGKVSLQAFGDVMLEAGGRVSVAGQNFNSAGQGGTIFLEAGAQRNGITGPGFVNIQSGSLLDLSVASKVAFNPATDATTPGTSAYLGQFSGKLHIRAPQVASGTDLQVSALDGTIIDASSILVEGYRLYDLTSSGGAITSAVQTAIFNDGTTFLGSAGTAGGGYSAMTGRLLANNGALESIFVLAPGAEIINRTGNLTLGSSSSTNVNDWNLSSFRFGAKSAPGVLTMRAAGNLVFFNALSDGFVTPGGIPLYRGELMAQNPLLPINTQSWSYRFTAGADLAAADFHRVVPLANLAANSGSLQLGKLITTNNGIPSASGGTSALTSSVIAQRYQVIRTGSGDIDISAGRDVQLLNQFATIYTAGTRTADPTLGGNFQVPPSVSIGNQGQLGGVQLNPTYAAQYSLGGGNVTITAGQDIKHQTQSGGVLVADSQKQIPNNWLYRRGYVDPLTGEFGITRDGEIGSTTWWVDFSNFFQGVGALGGGNVALVAGNDISNVDAVAPTNARMTYQTATGDRQAANQTLLELGGGDVTVRAGRNIDAGIYYVERGKGTLLAGNSIITNSTRTVNANTPPAGTPAHLQWLPTTLFLGKGGFDVSAAGDVLLGPTVNSFLLPTGLNNSFWRKTYFSTYASDSYLNVSSLGGNVTLRQSVTPFENINSDAGVQRSAQPILLSWLNTVHLLTSNPPSTSLTQPWLRLAETTVVPFSNAFTLLPGTVRATAFSGDINPVGTFNLSPSPVGTIELAAAGAINGLQPSGVVRLNNVQQITWTSARINLSDASPNAIPGINSPYANRVVAGTEAVANQRTRDDLFLFIDNMFRESGSSTGAQAFIQTQQALHGTSLLHASDSEPARLYAGSGDISGLTFFSSKFSKIVSGGNISDIAFYIQNARPSDVSIISSGRDIIAYNANSPLRVAAQASGNVLNDKELPLAGDLQISGPGTLGVFAGRNLDLGVGGNNADGTGAGLTSIGNARNPNLPFEGADIIAAAGVGPVYSLANSPLDFEGFLSEILEGPVGEGYLAEVMRANPLLFADLNGGDIESLDPELRAKLALEIFYLVLRDAGRSFNDETSPLFRQQEAYAPGYAAIATLFGDIQPGGDINTRARDIRTRSGGNISLLAPGGDLSLADITLASSLIPPGIITEAGGNVSIFTDGNIDIGISRIFTLRGGNAVIWSSSGDIAAGASAKTVQSAPPTRVLIDPQTAELKVDLAGLATGGGIGVLATVEGVEPGAVDLIAPNGTVDAGDAGIRATGDLNIAAVEVLNADNISVGGTRSGVPAAPVVAAPNIAGITSAASTAGAATAALEDVSRQTLNQAAEQEETPSLITVEVLGYGGGSEEEDEESSL